MRSAVPLRLDLASSPSSVREARTFVQSALAEWGRPDLAETAALLTSELASNVVLHARTPFAVVVSNSGRSICVDVLDDARSVPAVRAHDLTAATGRGLALVDGLADEWGPTPRTALSGFAKGVRFELS